MDLKAKKLAAAEDALQTLESVLLEPVSTIVQDATIQRFEYTLDQIWKVLQYVLEEGEADMLCSFVHSSKGSPSPWQEFQPDIFLPSAPLPA